MSDDHRIAAAAHVHSDWSYDGQWTLPNLAEVFAKRGYRVLMMTEHDRGFDAVRWRDYRQACAAASSEQLLIVPGIEYSDPSNVMHVLTWGAGPFLGENLSTTVTLDQAAQSGMYTVLAHPSRKNAWKHFDVAWAEQLSAVEVWNRKSDGVAPSREAWRLAREHGLRPFVGLDFHRKNQFFPLVMWLHGLVDATEENVCQILHEGRVTASAFGMNATRFESGVGAVSVHAAEEMRKKVRRVLVR